TMRCRYGGDIAVRCWKSRPGLPRRHREFAVSARCSLVEGQNSPREQVEDPVDGLLETGLATTIGQGAYAEQHFGYCHAGDEKRLRRLPIKPGDDFWRRLRP